MSALDALFAPRVVAVLGASRDPAKLGSRLLENVRAGGFAGRVIPVHPSGDRLLGLPSVARVDALPDGVDLALVSLPAPAVPAALDALARRGVGVAVVLSSGFGEVDEAGRDVQGALLASARAGGLRLVGPNCMGVYSAPAQLNGTYFWDLPKLPGGIAVVSQSGAYGGLIFRHLGARGLGVARFLSIGNQADVDVAELLDYLADDPATTLIACFIEALADGSRFVRAAARATAAKPVVILKGGRSDAGRRAAGSHTGSLAGSYEVYRAACRRAGAVLAEETEEFFDAIEALAAAGARRPATPRIAVITVSGGPSVVAADCAERSGLAVPTLGDVTRGHLRGLLPPFAAVGNPVDLTPQVVPARIVEAIATVMREPGIAGAVGVNVGLDIPEFADGLVAAMQATGKPVVAFTADAPIIAQRLEHGGVPVLASPERAVRAWRALWVAGRSRPAPGQGRGNAPAATAVERAGLALAADSETSCGGGVAVTSSVPSGDAAVRAAAGGVHPLRAPAVAADAARFQSGRGDGPVEADLRRAVDGMTGPLPYGVARRLLEAYGIRFCPERFASAVDEAVVAAETIGYPVVVKADVPGLTHKTEAGAVRLDVGSSDEVATVCAEFLRTLAASSEGAASASPPVDGGRVSPEDAPSRGDGRRREPASPLPDVRSTSPDDPASPAGAAGGEPPSAVPAASASVRFIVQGRVGPGVELLVGARRDETFGPVVVLGTGGVLTEVVGDVSLRLAPLPDDEAREMLAEGLRPRLLGGPRGLPPVDPDALVALLQAVASVIVAEPRILEIDLNPVIAAGADLVAVDALVVVGDTGRTA